MKVSTWQTMTISYAKFSADQPAISHVRPADLSPRLRQPRGVGMAQAGGLYRGYAKRFIDTVLNVLSATFVLPLIAVLAIIESQDGGSRSILSCASVAAGGSIDC
jgi:hypothetical protein